MLIAGAISAIVMSAMSVKQKQQTKKEQQTKKNVSKMEPIDRYAALASMKADDSPLASESNKDKNKDKTKKNVPKMSAMDRYAVLAEMKAKDGQPLPSPKDKNKVAAINAEEPFGTLAQMKAMEGTNDGHKDKNTEPKQQKAPEMMDSSADRYEVLADMKATRGDDVLSPEHNKASTRAM